MAQTPNTAAIAPGVHPKVDDPEQPVLPGNRLVALGPGDDVIPLSPAKPRTPDVGVTHQRDLVVANEPVAGKAADTEAADTEAADTEVADTKGVETGVVRTGSVGRRRE